MVDLHDLLDQGRFAVQAGIGGEQPGSVGQQDQRGGSHQVGHQGGNAVVVAEPDLVVGNSVVLVHNRHDPQLQQAGQGATGV